MTPNKKANILIVDDYKMIREAWKQLLHLQGSVNVVGEASNGKEAIALCKTLKPDLILMDINMPEMNGVDAIRIIKNNFPWIKIIALTVQMELAYVKSVLKYGAEGFVTKNSDKEELFQAIELAINDERYLCKDIQQLLLNNTIHDKEKKTRSLTIRELEIIRLIGEGLTSTQIADKLFLNIKTIESHRRNIFKKLAVKNSVELIKIAVERGLIIDF